MQVAAIGMHF